MGYWVPMTIKNLGKGVVRLHRSRGKIKHSVSQSITFYLIHALFKIKSGLFVDKAKCAFYIIWIA